MNKLYAIRQTGKSNCWYDFVEDFTSSELDKNCISNNFAYVKECQNNLGNLNPAWKNSEIVEFRELGEKDDFEDLYYKSLEQRADLEAKLAEREISLKNTIDHYEKYCGELNSQNIMLYASAFNYKQRNQDKISFAVEQINKIKNDLYENEKINIRVCDFDEIDNIFDNQIKAIKGREVV